MIRLGVGVFLLVVGLFTSPLRAQCTGETAKLLDTASSQNINAATSTAVSWDTTVTLGDGFFTHDPIITPTVLCVESDNHYWGRSSLEYTGPSNYVGQTRLVRHFAPYPAGGSANIASETVQSQINATVGTMLWTFVVELGDGDCLEVFVDRISGTQVITATPGRSTLTLTCLK